MVQEMITAVKEAETKAEGIIVDAEAQKKQLIADAKQKAIDDKMAAIQMIDETKVSKLAEQKLQLEKATEEANALISKEVSDLEVAVKEKENQGIEAIMKNFY